MAQPDQARHYAGKPEGYFDGARQDIVDLLPADVSAKILELGCGNGSTGHLAKQQGKCATYVGIDIDSASLKNAQVVIDRTILADIEKFDIATLGSDFDAIICSEVLEHLIDPWQIVQRFQGILKRKGMIFASSPNVANHRLIRELVKGHFEYQPSGVMDKTHLRWFTPESYMAMFAQAGFEDIELKMMGKPSTYWNLINALSFDRLKHLSASQMLLIGRKP